ncbi:MAG: LuxR C-terminal-related transcriptional regulator [Burkholderiaceae bacterium]
MAPDPDPDSSSRQRVAAVAHRMPARTRPPSIASKLLAPLATGAELERTLLCEEIFNAGAARLVLLRAPAGFGKTTVMLQVRRRFEESGVPMAWLTFDRADNDVGRFLSALIAALEPLVPALRSLDLSGGQAQDEIAFALIDIIAAHPAPLALFLDDFESLQAPVVLGLVQELIEQLPRGMQILIGSRGVPDIGLGSLRIKGRLLEIGPSRLRFSEQEVDRFFRERRGLALTAEDIRRLHRSTEGWSAALWLAAATLRHRDDPASFIAGFSGSNATVMDYLMEDVLSRLDPDMRRFLLCTSVLAQLNASVCDAVCGRQDSAAMLRRLERSHLFLAPLESDQTEFRYHGMFAEFLRAQLARQLPEEAPGLHRAAANWYLQAGRPVPAIEHALAARDFALALPLLDAHAQTLLEQGRVRLLSRWLDPLLRSGVLEDRPMLQAVQVWAVCLAHGPKPAVPLLERLESLGHTDPQVRAHQLAIKPLLMVLMDRTDEAMAFTEPLLEALPSSAAFVRGFLEVVLANLWMIAGRYREALRLADLARSRQPEHASSFNFALSEAAEGAVDLTQGRLRRAIARLRLAASAGAGEASRTTNGNAMAGVLLAEALYEADRCQQAERLLAVYIPLIRRVGIPDQLISAHVVMARIAIDRGDPDRAHQLLTELEHIGYRDGLTRVVASARLERVRILVVEGRVARARSELDRCGNRAMWQRVTRLSLRANEVETWDVALARWSIVSGHAHEVVDMLRHKLDASERAQRERRALTIRVLLAQALQRDDQRNRSMRVLAKAVRIAAAEGYVRLFLDEGPKLLGLLRELRSVPSVLLEDAEGAEDTTLAFLDRLLGEREPDEPRRTASSPSGPAKASAPFGELLTRKEIQVLRLAAEGLFNEQIAERMFVAETTVRTHLRNINVKLDTRNRLEAIAVARKAGLIS